jgi:copper chaperone CopZ
MKKHALAASVLIVLTYALHVSVATALPAGKQQHAAADKGKLPRIAVFTPRVYVNDPVDGTRVEFSKIEEVTKALERLPSVKIVDRTPEPPLWVVEFDTARVDVGQIAMAIAAVRQSEVKDLPPVATLLVFDPVVNKELLKGLLTKEQQTRLSEALRKVKGVDPKHSEVRDDTVWVALDDCGGAKFSDITAAIRSARQPAEPKEP